MIFATHFVRKCIFNCNVPLNLCILTDIREGENMNIKKIKVEKNCRWSSATQKKLAAALGLSAAFAVSACDGNSVSGGDIESTESSSSEVILDGMGPIDDGRQDLSSSSMSSSSSGKMSSSLEPTSGISSGSEPPRPLSSSSEDPPLSAGILPPSSSSYEIDTLDITSGEVYIEPESGSNIDTGHLESSSSVAPSSSSFKRIESSSATAGLPVSSSSLVMPPSSSSESEPLPGDPIEDPIIIDDPKD